MTVTRASLSWTQWALEGCLAGSDAEDGHGGEGGEASRKSARPEATVTSGAILSDQEDEGQEEGPPPPKKNSVSDSLDADKEQKLVDFITSNPIFYDQTLKEFKDKTCCDYLLGVIGTELGLTVSVHFLLTEALTFFQHYDVLKTFNIYFHNYEKFMFLVYFQILQYGHGSSRCGRCSAALKRRSRARLPRLTL